MARVKKSSLVMRLIPVTCFYTLMYRTCLSLDTDPMGEKYHIRRASGVPSLVVVVSPWLVLKTCHVSIDVAY